MAVVIVTRSVHMRHLTMLLDAAAKWATRMWVPLPMSLALVRCWMLTHSSLSYHDPIDSCQVNNGQCDVNADCSHEPTTFAVKCTCKVGFTNISTSSSSNGSCTGRHEAYSQNDLDRSTCTDVLIVDSCLVNNGGCHVDATCSHDSKTNAVICTCKVGYTNTGSSSNVVCVGK
jgi:hypothetical protein